MTHCLVNHHITGHLVFVLVSTERVMMYLATDNPAICEIHAVIHFLHTQTFFIIVSFDNGSSEITFQIALVLSIVSFVI
jgi:hypothetical protein